mgnify:CR=1 FL=1
METAVGCRGVLAIPESLLRSASWLKSLWQAASGGRNRRSAPTLVKMEAVAVLRLLLLMGMAGGSDGGEPLGGQSGHQSGYGARRCSGGGRVRCERALVASRIMAGSWVRRGKPILGESVLD